MIKIGTIIPIILLIIISGCCTFSPEECKNGDICTKYKTKKLPPLDENTEKLLKTQNSFLKSMAEELTEEEKKDQCVQQFHQVIKGDFCSRHKETICSDDKKCQIECGGQIVAICSENKFPEFILHMEICKELEFNEIK